MTPLSKRIRPRHRFYMNQAINIILTWLKFIVKQCHETWVGIVFRTLQGWGLQGIQSNLSIAYYGNNSSVCNRNITLDMVRAGLHCSFKISRQMLPLLLILGWKTFVLNATCARHSQRKAKLINYSMKITNRQKYNAPYILKPKKLFLAWA